MLAEQNPQHISSELPLYLGLQTWHDLCVDLSAASLRNPS
jgi:hypothetical protein